jgi:hypothetical protein
VAWADAQPPIIPEVFGRLGFTSAPWSTAEPGEYRRMKPPAQLR